MAFSVNIFHLSVKCQWTLSVYEDVGDCDISSKYFSSLGKMPTDAIRLQIHQWGFLNLKKKLLRINNIKSSKLIVKKPIMQIKFY